MNDQLSSSLLKAAENEVRKSNSKGLTLCCAIFFVVGDIVGAGIVTLPYIMKIVSWWGIPLFIAAATLMGFCGVLLSKACIIAFTDRRGDKLRDPYPQLAGQAYGKKAKYSVVVILNLSLVFSCIIFLSLLGEIFTQIAPLSQEHISLRSQLRIWFLICSITILPLTFLGSPKDFACVGLLATLCSCLSGLMILINVAMVAHVQSYHVPSRTYIKPETILAAFGTLQFTFGGIAIFPTIQNDLEHPEKFPVAVAAGYTIVFIVYSLISITTFVILDEKIQEDILATFSSLHLYKDCPYFRIFVLVAQILICGHVMSAFVMIINPVNQQVEELFDAPTRM